MESIIQVTDKTEQSDSQNVAIILKLTKGKIKAFFLNIFKNILKLFCVYPFFYES